MIERYVEQVSTYAGDIDQLILLIAVIVGFWGLLAEVVLVGLALKYRAKDGVKSQYVDGSDPKHKRFINWPHGLVLLFDIVIIVFAVNVWMTVKQDLPEADRTVRIIGQQWAWTFVHPGPDGKLDTGDDIKTIDELHIEQNLTYRFELQSKDVLHSFSVPVFRLKQDAIPGRTIRGWFKATKSGEWSIQCAEMCGIGHGIMGARIHIGTKEQHAAWLTSKAATSAPTPDPTPAKAPAPEPAPAPEGDGDDANAEDANAETATPPAGDAQQVPEGEAAEPAGSTK